jgi:hypothetical protein
MPKDDQAKPKNRKRYPPPRQRKLPAGPDERNAAWQPPGAQGRPEPPPVPAAVRRDKRQRDLFRAPAEDGP